MSDEPTVRNRPYLARTFTALQRIGPYRLIRSIGEGGIGTVFLAHQDARVSRTVAIKSSAPRSRARKTAPLSR